MFQRRILRGLVVSVCPVLVPAAALAYDCGVHINRTITVNAGSGATASTSYRELCRTTSAERLVCVCNNTGAVLSDPSLSACPTGYTEIGKCQAASFYAQTCDTCSGSTCTSGTCEGGCQEQGAYCADADFTFSFVTNASRCENTGHDPLSAVMGCRSLCEHYFRNRYYDKNDTSQGSNYGSWRIGTHASIPSLAGVGEWRVEACKDRCGPPTADDPTPPWGTWVPPDDNNWRYVSFNRRNANDVLDRWLRSYSASVPDRPAPKTKCEELVNDYCDDPTVAPTVYYRAQCKKNLLLWLQLLPGTYTAPVDFIAPTAFDFSSNSAVNLANDGFCDNFFRGHWLADGTCYERDNGAPNSQHFCGGTSCSPDGTLGGGCNDCSAATGTCDGGNPFGAFNVATILVPAKSGTCGTATNVVVTEYVIAASYSGAGADVVRATWENETTGAKGDLQNGPFGWLSASGPRGPVINVPFVSGINVLRVKFVDKKLRVSGDVIVVNRTS